MDPRQQPPQQPGQSQPPSANNPNVPGQQPEVYNSPTLSSMPNGNPAASVPASFSASSNRRRGPVIAIIVGVVTALILVLAAIFATNSGNKSADRADAPNQQAAGTSQVIEPAQAIEVEQTNNSISQDLSGLDEEKDFPATGLDDKSLSL